MESIIVKGGQSLTGSVEIEGAKNAALPILAASILAEEGESTLENVPLLSDIYTIEKVLNYLNIETNFDEERKEMTVDAKKSIKSDTPFEFMNKMRASFLVMGPLLARNGEARVAMPGGCSIGSRPIDLHLKGFKAMGAEIEEGNGYIQANTDQLQGANIYLDFPSVGATQNIVMAATLAEGQTVIENAAREPEIVDLVNYLNLMGADIVGAGTEEIRIQGVSKLRGAEHSIIPDRIESGTFMVAAAITNGNVLVEEAVSEHNLPLIAKLREMGVEVQEEEKGIRVIGPEKLKATDFKTQPYPGFPTDMQAQITIAQLKAEGQSTMEENVFENRFMHLDQMKVMDANFKIDGQIAVLYGGHTLQGGEVASTDLRASAALILAGLIAEGHTKVTALDHLDRGYYHFHKKLQKLGADLERVSSEEKNKEMRKEKV
ncbi:MAG: UDP-N-acetylglucosamine 1-carboxyvinyltransferase [Atopostipes sp.]|nr:UDP-N-acetylglucosamine 1-carboxyvinyltransferase [Atopostipes sp.]